MFVALYLASGLTDLLDGKIARRFHFESDFGSKLDTWADMALFIAAIASVFIAKLEIDVLKCLIPFSIAIYHKCLNVMIGRVRFGTWNMLHTLLSKNIGAAVYFCVPAFILLGEINFFVILVISLFGIVVYIEETVTLLKLDEFNVNHKGYLTLKVMNKLKRAKAS